MVKTMIEITQLPEHITYMQSMLERNWDHKVKMQLYSKDITQFIFTRAQLSGYDIPSMCKYCKIDLEMIAEWSCRCKSNRTVEIILWVKHTKETKWN